MPEKMYVSLKAVIVQNGRALILKGTDPDDNIVWDLPGGRIDAGEINHDTLYRELQEELPTIQNISIGPILAAYKAKRITRDGTPLFIVIYEVSADLPTIQLSPEHTEYRWVTADELRNLEKTDPTPIYQRFQEAILTALE